MKSEKFIAKANDWGMEKNGYVPTPSPTMNAGGNKGLVPSPSPRPASVQMPPPPSPAPPPQTTSNSSE